MPADLAFRVILSDLGAIGLDPAVVCSAAGVDARLVDDPAAPLGVGELGRILECAEMMVGDSLLGLHLAEWAPGRGVLSYLARAQRTVAEGLRAFARFADHVWDTAAAVAVEARGIHSFIEFRLDPAVPRHAVEYLVARTAIGLRRSRARAQEARFRHAPVGAACEYERVLRCPVRFRQVETGLSVLSADLARPLRTANRQAAEALAAALTPPAARAEAPLSRRTAGAIEAVVARGQRVDRELVARSLGMSGKTLCRRLAMEGCLFRDLVEEVRRALAQRLLSDASLALSEVAARTGFADAAAFGKAFRRWFGEAPSVVRRRSAGLAVKRLGYRRLGG